MARIIFFTEKLPPAGDAITAFAYDLIRALADQQHEIRVLSTYDPESSPPPTPPHVEILRPFKKWSWLEVPAVAPLIMEFRPDILHFIQPWGTALSGLTNAMSALPGLAPLAGNPAVASSFFDIRDETLPAHRLLLLASDAITVANQAQADAIARYLKKSKRSPLIEVVPSPGALSSSSDDASTTDELGSPLVSATGPAAEALEKFFSTHDRIAFFPGDIDLFTDPSAVFELLSGVLLNFEDTGVVLGGGWGSLKPLARRGLMEILDNRGLGGRVFITGALESDTQRALLARADVVFAAALPHESIALTRLLRDALAVGAVLVISREQSELDPLPWQDRTHAYISRGGVSGWGAAIADALASRELAKSIRTRIREFHQRETLDHPGNLTSRLYSRLIESRAGRRRGPFG